MTRSRTAPKKERSHRWHLLCESLEERCVPPARALIPIGDPFQQFGHQHVEFAGRWLVDRLGKVVRRGVVAFRQPFLGGLTPRGEPLSKPTLSASDGMPRRMKLY